MFSERSLGHIPSLNRDSHIAPEWQPHVAFDGWTLQSTAELPFAEGTLWRMQQQKSHVLTSPGMNPSLPYNSGRRSVCLPASYLFR